MLSRLLRIQPGEGWTVGAVVALMFVAVAGLTIGESGISALFFDRIGSDALPLLYLGQGAVGLTGMLALTAALGRFERRRAYVVLPALLGAVVVVERVVAATDVSWIYPTLWLTTTVAYLVQGVYLWGAAGLVTDTRRAKRLFPLFAGGSILGAVVGGVLTRPLASSIGTENLLVIWAMSLFGVSALSAVVLGVRPGAGRTPRRGRRPSGLAEIRVGFAFVRRSRLFLWMSAASVLFSVLFYSLYLPFARASTQRFSDPEQLAGFFGVFWAAVTAAAFLVSMLLANRMLGRFGAAIVILVLPFLYAGGFGILFVTSTFATLVATRFAATVWLQGVASPAWETLINVAPEQRRDQARAFLNGGPAQAGTAIAGVVQLVGQDALSARQLTLVGLVVAGATIAVGWRIRSSYTSALVDAIRAGRPRVFDDAILNAPVAVRSDAVAVGLALEAMDDPDPRMRRLAGELLAGADDDRAMLALHEALRDEDPLVRSQAVEVVAARDALAGEEVERALGDGDPRVRLAAVRALEPRRTPTSLLADPDPAVTAAAAGRLLAGDSGTAAVEALHSLLEDEDADTRLVALGELGRVVEGDDEADRAIRDASSALVAARLDDPSPTVRAAAIGTLARIGSDRAVTAAMEALRSADTPSVRDAAVRALDRVDRERYEDQLRVLIQAAASEALRDGAVARRIPAAGEAADLLRSALVSRSRRNAMVALQAASVLSEDRGAMRVALEQLGDAEGPDLANALETIEVAGGTPLARSLIPLWERTAEGAPAASNRAWLEEISAHEDGFIRACAELARSERDGGRDMARSSGSMSPMELVLVLRRIPLFSTLAPEELRQVAAIAEERSFTDGDALGGEGEIGDELHVILDGTVRVVRRDGGTVARRGAGDVVGEMSLITRSPRVASLLAEGNVRTLRIGHREFEAMVRERPDIALAVMRVLAERLAAMTAESADRM